MNRTSSCLCITQFTNKVKVNFNILSTSMETRISSHVGGAKVVTPKRRSTTKVNAKFTKHGLDPNDMNRTNVNCSGGVYINVNGDMTQFSALIRG
jgi:hypothetical protein